MRRCVCHHLPERGAFRLGREYPWSYTIDGVVVTDDAGERIDFDEYSFLWYFSRLS